MVEVIAFTFTEDEYINGVLFHKAGDMIVSHGVNHNTGENVILPQENFSNFVKEYCFFENGCWFLK